MQDSFFICHQIAEMMSSFAKVEQIIEDLKNRGKSANSWQKWSLAEGMPGISLFYSAMHNAFPYENWDKIAEEYIFGALHHLKNYNIHDISLLTGLTGISLAAFNALSEKLQYQKIISDLDEWLIEEVRKSYLSKYLDYTDPSKLIPPTFYNFSNGISGIISYLLIRKDNPYLLQLANECVNTLSSLMTLQKEVEDLLVPSWFILQQNLSTEENKNLYLKGGYISNYSFGVAGCLTSLALAALNGISSDNSIKTLKSISSWLLEKYNYINQNNFWNSTIPLEDNIFPLPSEYHLLQYSWLNGWPPVAKSLYLTGKALNDSSLMKFAEDFFSIFIKDINDVKIFGTPFSTGISGFMMISHFMATATKNPKYFNLVNHLKKLLIEYYNPSAPFGFQQPFYNNDGSFYLFDFPGFFYGAAGIGFSMLLIEDRLKNNIF